MISGPDEALVLKLPLPLARLYRLAHGARTPLEQHAYAFYLWEASLKLLGSVAVVEHLRRSEYTGRRTLWTFQEIPEDKGRFLTRARWAAVDGRVCPWYSMEFALGGDLRARIDKRKGLLKGGVPWEDAEARSAVCGEFAEVAAAVAHLHGLGFVHRDLKPGNVLIMEDGGCACRTSGWSRTSGRRRRR
jgi:serine/threonine protein kinase